VQWYREYGVGIGYWMSGCVGAGTAGTGADTLGMCEVP
jgi:hypothetical protein